MRLLRSLIFIGSLVPLFTSACGCLPFANRDKQFIQCIEKGRLQQAQKLHDQGFASDSAVNNALQAVLSGVSCVCEESAKKLDDSTDIIIFLTQVPRTIGNASKALWYAQTYKSKILLTALLAKDVALAEQYNGDTPLIRALIETPPDIETAAFLLSKEVQVREFELDEVHKKVNEAMLRDLLVAYRRSGQGSKDALYYAYEARSLALFQQFADTTDRPLTEIQPAGTTYLHQAVDEKREAMVRCIGAIPGMIDLGDQYGRTALHVAAQKCDVEMVSCLMQLGASTRYHSKAGMMPLQLAIEQKKVSLITLLARPDSINMVVPQNGAAIHFAARTNAVLCIDELLRCGADIRTIDGEGNSALHVAALNKSSLSAGHLLAHDPQLAQMKNNAQHTPLYEALRLNDDNLATITALLSYYPDLNSDRFDYGWTYLDCMYHYHYGKNLWNDVAELLINKGAKTREELEATRPLADVEYERQFKHPRAALTEQEIIEWNKVLVGGFLKDGRFTMQRALYEGADPNLMHDGQSILYWVLADHSFEYNDKIHLLRLLIIAGADKYRPNEDSCKDTPIDYAQRKLNKDEKILAILCNIGSSGSSIKN